jgi:hypothetical protein
MDRMAAAIGIATVCLIFGILASHLQEIWSRSVRDALRLLRSPQKICLVIQYCMLGEQF